MFRYLERSENTTRLLNTAFHIALTRSTRSDNEWNSILSSIGSQEAFRERYDELTPANVTDFLLRDKTNPTSVLSMLEAARNNARLVRAALTREVWEAMNECWMVLNNELSRPVQEKNLPATLESIRKQTSMVRASLHSTMLRNDIYNFCRLGTFIERADSTARILDVKYYVLLPSVAHVGSSLDNVQWETILRSVSALRSYRWLHGGEVNATGIADFLILDARMPRSLAFCLKKIDENLGYLEMSYGQRLDCQDQADKMFNQLRANSIEQILENGLHEFLVGFLADNNALGQLIERNYQFYE